jgi:hypothetical protein
VVSDSKINFCSEQDPIAFTKLHTPKKFTSHEHKIILWVFGSLWQRQFVYLFSFSFIMKSIKYLIRFAIIFGVLAFLGLILSFLSLEDIYQGLEPDLTLEWSIVRITFFLILLFVPIAIFTIWRLSQRVKTF